MIQQQKMMISRDEKRSAPSAKLGKSIAFGCALGVIVSLLKHQRDEGHMKRARVEHERAMMMGSGATNFNDIGGSGSGKNRRMGDTDFNGRSFSGGE